ncbi:hypothetical protein A3D23_02820 [candidate division WOR-1 bacterium RIFCSPHIGHO2_02_FULL_53_26]|nr:MAG: hypothetical protein A3D23_02820 [candidate division WOR-1 bacterium RIFCSPHIGHO2_02_FULL_53_26]
MGIVRYQQARFPCGELFPKPLESVRGKQVVLLGTVNPATAADDIIRVQLMLDGLYRMGQRGVHLVMPYLPEPLELMPLFTNRISSLTTVNIAPAARMGNDARSLVNGMSLASFLKQGAARVFGLPFGYIDLIPDLASHLAAERGQEPFTLLGLRGGFIGKALPGRFSAKIPEADFNFVSLIERRSKNGKMVTGIKAEQGEIRQRAILFMREIGSMGSIRRILDFLAGRRVSELALGVVHPVYPAEFPEEIGQDERVKSVMISDTTGIPGENFLLDGKVEGVELPALPPKFKVVETDEPVARVVQMIAKTGSTLSHSYR